jgi:hypothetical protein
MLVPILASAGMKTGVQMSLPHADFISFDYTPRCGTAGEHGN